MSATKPKPEKDAQPPEPQPPEPQTEEAQPPEKYEPAGQFVVVTTKLGQRVNKVQAWRHKQRTGVELDVEAVYWNAGDIVTLDKEDARRFLLSGSVIPPDALEKRKEFDGELAKLEQKRSKLIAQIEESKQEARAEILAEEQALRDEAGGRAEQVKRIAADQEADDRREAVEKLNLD